MRGSPNFYKVLYNGYVIQFPVIVGRFGMVNSGFVVTHKNRSIDTTANILKQHWWNCLGKSSGLSQTCKQSIRSSSFGIPSYQIAIDREDLSTNEIPITITSSSITVGVRN